MQQTESNLSGVYRTPTTSKDDAVVTVNKMSAWVKQFDLDGIEVNYKVHPSRFEALLVGALQKLISISPTGLGRRNCWEW